MRYYVCESEKPLGREEQREKAQELFRHALEKEIGVRVSYDYERDGQGKPLIPSPNSSLHLSVAHCKFAVVCIISDARVGIDVEEISRFDVKLSRRICTPKELVLIEASENKQEALCRCWTLKEAFYKMHGSGVFSEIETSEIKNSHVKKRDGTTPLLISIVSEKPLDDVTFCAYPS